MQRSHTTIFSRWFAPLHLLLAVLLITAAGCASVNLHPPAYEGTGQSTLDLHNKTMTQARHQARTIAEQQARDEIMRQVCALPLSGRTLGDRAIAEPVTQAKLLDLVRSAPIRSKQYTDQDVIITVALDKSAVEELLASLE